MGPEMILADWPKVATKVAVIYKKRLIYIDADDYRDKGTQCTYRDHPSRRREIIAGVIFNNPEEEYKIISA